MSASRGRPRPRTPPGAFAELPSTPRGQAPPVPRGALTMILPLGDAPNPRGIPFITYALILANCAVYLLVTLPLSVQAPDPNDPALWEYVRLVTGILPAGGPGEEGLSRASA